ncbi:MAG: hypothetical protein IPG99_12355 [Ignavibacteria bacterium]|nr:hypothetical protein [Ignavibacteria bacterium]
MESGKWKVESGELRVCFCLPALVISTHLSLACHPERSEGSTLLVILSEAKDPLCLSS